MPRIAVLLLPASVYAQVAGFSRGPVTCFGAFDLTTVRSTVTKKKSNTKPRPAILPRGKTKKRTPKRKLKAAPGLGPGPHHTGTYKGPKQ
jgi:hypothetical protein